MGNGPTCSHPLCQTQRGLSPRRRRRRRHHRRGAGPGRESLRSRGGRSRVSAWSGRARLLGLHLAARASARPGLQAPWREPSDARLGPPRSAGAAGGSPAWGTGSVRSARRGPGHNAVLPLDTRARSRRRHLPGSAWTGASSRGQGSGSCLQPGSGLGLRQVRTTQGRARGGGRLAARERPDSHSPRRAPRGLDMSAQEPPQGRRFPIEAGDSPGLAAVPESQDSPEPVATEHNPVRPLRRCPGCHCLTLLHVPIDVYLAMGGSPRARAT
nr:protein FAM229A isoform X1 [Oryctolagus cuniculus]